MICAWIPLSVWGAYEYGRMVHEMYKDYIGKPHYLSHLYDMRHEGTFKLFKAATLANLSQEMHGIAILVTACVAMIFPEVFMVTVLEASIFLGISVGVYLFNQLFKLSACYYLATSCEQEKK